MNNLVERLEHVAKAYVPHSELAADALAYIRELESRLAQQGNAGDQEAPRMIAFLELLDKRLEAAGYEHKQRLEIAGILMSNKVEGSATQANQQGKEAETYPTGFPFPINKADADARAATRAADPAQAEQASDERQLFEAWVKKAYNAWIFDATDTVPEPSLWLAWQARAALQGAQQNVTDAIQKYAHHPNCDLLKPHVIGDGDSAIAVARMCDCKDQGAQLSPVPVAWARKWHVEGEKPAKVRNENNRLVWPSKFKFLPVTPRKVFDDDVPLAPLYAASQPSAQTEE